MHVLLLLVPAFARGVAAREFSLTCGESVAEAMVHEPSAAARPLSLAAAFNTSGLSRHFFEAASISRPVRVRALSIV